MKHLKAFIHFLSRNKLYTAINIFGFAVSLTFVVLVGLYVQNEFSVDASQSKADRIVLLRHDLHYSWPSKIAADIQGRYPEIEATMRHHTNQMTIKKAGDSQATFCDALQTDSTFFTMFDVHFIEGSAGAALVDMQSVVLSQNYARQMFGDESALGRQFEIGGHQYTVSGVVDNLENSIIRPFDCILRFETVGHQWEGYLTQYNSCMFSIFVLLKPGTSLAPKYVDMVTWFKEFFWLYQQGHAKWITAVPLRDAYWDTDTSNLRSNDSTLVDILMVCALAILLFAIINYINLSIAQTTFRAKQAATRRLLGGTKTELFFGFVFESTILCAVSLLLAVSFAVGLVGWFNSTLQTNVDLQWLLAPTNIAIVIGSLLVLGFVSGVIPASIITRFKPISVVRGDFRRRSKMVLSKILIGVQYLITIVLIGCAITIGRQTSFLINADLGFDRHQVIVMSNMVWDKNVWSTYSALGSVAGVEQVALSKGAPTEGYNNHTFTHNETQYSFSIFATDTVFMDLLGIEIVSRTGVIDSGAVWINEAGARKMGLKPTDVKMPWYDRYLPLKGVVRDFHFTSMEQNVSEAIIEPMGDDYPWNVLVKISSDDLAAAKDAVVAAYKEFSGSGVPVEAEFVDANVEQWYVKQKQTQSLVGMISILAIIISALGILAMSTYFIGQRRGEIAVRKVFGSSNANIFSKLTLQFLIIIAIAFVASVPIIYYFMEQWLSGFAYRIELRWDIFVMAGLAAFAIAMVTISWKAYQAMNANPVKSLKSE